MADTEHDTWVICRHRFHGTGKSAVVSVNTTLEKRLTFAEYPFHISISIDAAEHSLDGSGRIGAHESQHLVNLGRVIRASLESEDQHLACIVHGAGARTLELYARDGEAVAGRLRALKDEKTWDRSWAFEVKPDPQGRLGEPWREIARASEDHHLAINVPHAGPDREHHHFLF